MKKIPTLFERVFDNHHKVGINNKVHPGMEWVLGGEGTATEKIDGSCCAVIDGVFYKRYDAKRGKIPPANAIPCCDPDPITGHWPHWVPVDESDKSNIWLMEAYRNAGCPTEEGTYEAIGPHFRTNPYGLEKDVIEKHGMYTALAPVPLSAFAGEPTQNIGKSFLKSYASVCLEGAIIVLACIIFSVFASSPPVVDPNAAPASMVWSYIGELIFNMLILVGAVKMADRLVKEMMGI